jgi:hypothetical protein
LFIDVFKEGSPLLPGAVKLSSHDGKERNTSWEFQPCLSKLGYSPRRGSHSDTRCSILLPSQLCLVDTDLSDLGDLSISQTKSQKMPCHASHVQSTIFHYLPAFLTISHNQSVLYSHLYTKKGNQTSKERQYNYPLIITNQDIAI